MEKYNWISKKKYASILYVRYGEISGLVKNKTNLPIAAETLYVDKIVPCFDEMRGKRYDLIIIHIDLNDNNLMNSLQDILLQYNKDAKIIYEPSKYNRLN